MISLLALQVEVTSTAIGSEANEEAIVAKLRTLKAFSPPALGNQVISKLRKLGLFSSEKVNPQGNLLDTLCKTLDKECAYAPGERDLVMLQHEFIIERADGKVETLTSTLEAYGSSTGGPSAMARLVGVPCGIAVQLVLDGKISEKGILAPYDEAVSLVRSLSRVNLLLISSFSSLLSDVPPSRRRVQEGGHPDGRRHHLDACAMYDLILSSDRDQGAKGRDTGHDRNCMERQQQTDKQTAQTKLKIT